MKASERIWGCSQMAWEVYEGMKYNRERNLLLNFYRLTCLYSGMHQFVCEWELTREYCIVCLLLMKDYWNFGLFHRNPCTIDHDFIYGRVFTEGGSMATGTAVRWELLCLLLPTKQPYMYNVHCILHYCQIMMIKINSNIMENSLNMRPFLKFI